MKKILFVFTFLISMGVMAQVQTIRVVKPKANSKLKYQDSLRALKDSLKNRRGFYSTLTIDVYYGTKLYGNSFYDQLNLLNTGNFSAPPKILGFGFSNYYILWGARSSCVVQMFYSKYLNSPINIQDTMASTITGFSYHFGIGKIKRFARGRINLAAYIGFNTGRLKLSSSGNFKQVNNFFSPTISLQPKVFITKRIALSFIVNYEFDVSKTNWRVINNTSATSISNFKQSGLTALVALGYSPWLYH